MNQQEYAHYCQIMRECMAECRAKGERRVSKIAALMDERLVDKQELFNKRGRLSIYSRDLRRVMKDTPAMDGLQPLLLPYEIEHIVLPEAMVLPPPGKDMEDAAEEEDFEWPETVDMTFRQFGQSIEFLDVLIGRDMRKRNERRVVYDFLFPYMKDRPDEKFVPVLKKIRAAQERNVCAVMGEIEDEQPEPAGVSR